MFDNISKHIVDPRRMGKYPIDRKGTRTYFLNREVLSYELLRSYIAMKCGDMRCVWLYRANVLKYD